MPTYTGVIEKCYKNDRGTFSINVNGVWYGTYKTDLRDLEGQEVEFEADSKEVKGNIYWNAKNVKPTAAAQAPAPAPQAAPQAAPQGAPKAAAAPKAEGFDTRQSSIVLQASYKVAAPVLQGLIAGDKLPLGAKGAAFDNAKGLLDEMARHIYDNCIDPQAFLSGEETPATEEGYSALES